MERGRFTDHTAGQQRTVNGKTTTNSGQWNSPRVRRLLVNQRYAGLKVHRGKVIGKADWTPLIDEDTHRGLVAYLSDPKRVKNTSLERKYIGSGVYICGKCGGRMKSVWPTGRKTFAYVCGVKADILRSGAPLDDFVSAVVWRGYQHLTRTCCSKTSTSTSTHCRPNATHYGRGWTSWPTTTPKV